MPISVFLTDFSPPGRKIYACYANPRSCEPYFILPIFPTLKNALVASRKKVAHHLLSDTHPKPSKKEIKRHVLHEKTNNKNRLLNSIYISLIVTNVSLQALLKLKFCDTTTLLQRKI